MRSILPSKGYFKICSEVAQAPCQDLKKPRRKVTGKRLGLTKPLILYIWGHSLAPFGVLNCGVRMAEGELRAGILALLAVLAGANSVNTANKGMR